MNGLIIGVYGIFFLLVGLAGNAPKLLGMVGDDAGNFLPWVVAIAALSVAYEYPATQKMARPFILLLILSFVLYNYDNLLAEYKRLQNLSNQ